jgi:hypothetical protein
VVARGRRCDALPALTTNETTQDPTRAAADLEKRRPSPSRPANIAAATDKEQATMSSIAGELVIETFGYDGGRQVTVHVLPT